MKPAKHYIAEWERHPDLFSFPLTCSLDGLAALRVAALAADAYDFPQPTVMVNRRQWGKSTCLGSTRPYHGRCFIQMRANFTTGELLHELAHAYRFWHEGDASHGPAFRDAMESLCRWFRNTEKAQAILFP